MRLPVFLLSVLVLVVSPSVRAQVPDESPEVLSAVQSLFDAMAARDTAVVRAVFLPELTLMSVTIRNGAPSYAITPGGRFIEQLGAATEPWHERMWDPRVEVRGPIASVWAPYDFRLGETFSHCGVNNISLAKTQDGWRVAAIVYSVERENCEG
jgi:hypothetical protein